jgi:hypothetical protein
LIENEVLGVINLVSDAISDSKPWFPRYIDLFDSRRMILSVMGTYANYAGT